MDSGGDYDVSPARYPASTRTAQSDVAGTPTAFAVVSFADKIIVTISQEGRLAHWLNVPITSSAPPFTSIDTSDLTESALLPPTHLTPMPLLGNPPTQNLQTATQLLSTQIASALLTKNSDESRGLVLGIGFGKNIIKSGEVSRDVFASLFEGVLACL